MKKICIVLLLGLMQACHSPEKASHTGVYTIRAEAGLNESPETISLKKIAKKIEVIPLETTDASLIGQIRELALYKQYIFLLHGEKCSVFDRKGKFISDIGQRGNGPQEYLKAENVFVRGDTVYLYDSYKNKVHMYAVADYRYLSSIPIEEKYKDFRGIALTETGDFVVFTPDKGYPSVKRALTFWDVSGRVKDSVLRVSALSGPANINWYFNECTFVRHDGELRYKDVFNDTLYTIRQNDGRYGVTPKYIFDLGKYKALPDAREQVSKSFFAAKVFDPFSVMAKIELLGESETYLFFSAKGERMYYYDKTADQLHKWTLTVPGYENNCMEDAAFFVPMQIDGSGNLLGVMKSGNENDNPAIVIAKSK